MLTAIASDNREEGKVKKEERVPKKSNELPKGGGTFYLHTRAKIRGGTLHRAKKVSEGRKDGDLKK